MDLWLALCIGILKYTALFLIGFVIWFVYTMIIQPWMMRRKYLKYPNGDQSDKFNPVLGDFALYLENIKQNKFLFYNDFVTATTKRNVDIRLGFSDQPMFHLFSLKAHKEFQDLYPQKIDRTDYFKKFITKMGVNSIDHIPTNEKYKVIRSEFMKSLGINEISNRIPDIIEIFEKITNTWTEEKMPNLIGSIEEITFGVINHLLFGSDSFQIMKNGKYYEPNGTETTLEFGMFFRKIVDDGIKNYFSLWYKLFPFLADHSLMQPFKTDKKNIDNLNLYLKEFIRLTKDNQSGLTKMIENGLLSIEEITESIKSFLGAGSETSARCVCSIVYYLNKYPKGYDKLIQELKSGKVLKEDGSLDSISKEAISDCDYLGYVVKEALRIDPPAIVSICYKSLQDIVICGIPIPKDNLIVFNQISRQYNPDEWHDPFNFIPERFDPTSSLFNIPNSNSKSRDAISFAPFSFGMRSCPGQILALFQIKVILILLLSKYKIKVSQDLIQNEFARFSTGSHIKLEGQVTRKFN